MALLSHVSCAEYYNYERDGYDIPNFGFLSGFDMRKIEAQRIKDEQEIKDRLDAEKAYDPYNHEGASA